MKPGLNIFTLVNDLSSAQFVTINVDGTVTSNDTCVVISAPVGSSRFHNFYVSQLYRAYIVTMLSRRLCTAVKRPLHIYNRYTDTVVGTWIIRDVACVF